MEPVQHITIGKDPDLDGCNELFVASIYRRSFNSGDTFLCVDALSGKDGRKVLEPQGFEVGYGTNGVGQAWPDHGRGNHAHVEWVGQGSSEDAIKKLAGLTNADLQKIYSSVASGGSVPAGAISAYAAATGVSQRAARKRAASHPEGLLKTLQQRLPRVWGAYGESESTLTRPTKGSPVL